MNHSIRTSCVTLSRLLLATSALIGASDACQPLYDATTKVVTTPNHVYTTQAADFLRGKTRTSETIRVNGVIYIKHQWKMDQERDHHAGHPATGAGKPEEHQDNVQLCAGRAVYSARSVTENATPLEVQVWISKTKGGPPREELGMNVGCMAGTSHMSMRYDHGNVQPPAGVQ